MTQIDDTLKRLNQIRLEEARSRFEELLSGKEKNSASYSKRLLLLL